MLAAAVSPAARSGAEPLEEWLVHIDAGSIACEDVEVAGPFEHFGRRRRGVAVRGIVAHG